MLNAHKLPRVSLSFITDLTRALHSSGETPPVVLHPVLELSTGEICWSRSRGGHRKDLRAGTPQL